ncbi:carboxypeptidase-like regulatory domain-containing protein [Alistipes timonensis]|nr:carboxypeptidase-like regulatory domain-containing protein [Alistipes timonensis]
MIGATVWLKDTSIGTSTDVNGFYSITFPSNYFVLSFSYLRYEA